MIIGPFLLSSKKLRFFITLKNWSSTDWVFSDSYITISIGRFQPIYV